MYVLAAIEVDTKTVTFVFSCQVVFSISLFNYVFPVSKPNKYVSVTFADVKPSAKYIRRCYRKHTMTQMFHRVEAKLCTISYTVEPLIYSNPHVYAPIFFSLEHSYIHLDHIP